MLVCFFENIGAIVKLLMQLSCMVFIFITSNTSINRAGTVRMVCNSFAVFIMTYWCLFSFKKNKKDSMIRFSVYIILPLLCLIQFADLLTYFSITYLEPVLGVTPNPKSWIQSHNTNIFMMLLFIYIMIETIQYNKLKVKNSTISAFQAYLDNLMQFPGQNPFQAHIDFCYRFYFTKFNYIMLTMIIIISMYEVNFINLFLMFYSITFLSNSKKSTVAWTYYVFVLDIYVLIK